MYYVRRVWHAGDDQAGAITDEWQLEADVGDAMEVVLHLLDADLAVLPVHRIDAAKAWPVKILQAGSFPEMSSQV